MQLRYISRDNELPLLTNHDLGLKSPKIELVPIEHNPMYFHSKSKVHYNNLKIWDRLRTVNLIFAGSQLSIL